MNLTHRLRTVLAQIIDGEVHLDIADWAYRRAGSTADLTDLVYALADVDLVELQRDGRVTPTVHGVRAAHQHAQQQPEPIVPALSRGGTR